MFNLQQGRRAELHAFWFFGGGPVVAATCAENTTDLHLYTAHARFVSHRVSPATPCQLPGSSSEVALKGLLPEWLPLCVFVMV